MTTCAAWNAGHASQENASAAVRSLEIMRSDLNRHSPSNLAHRRQERQSAIWQLDGFVSHCRYPVVDQRLGKGFVSSEMEIGEQDLIRAKKLVLGRHRFLDLQNHVGFRENVGMGINKLRSGRFVLEIGEIRCRVRQPARPEHDARERRIRPPRLVSQPPGSRGP